jgi:DeoR/GlpR family transcriptional regulator of sugar metabolism
VTAHDHELRENAAMEDPDTTKRPTKQAERQRAIAQAVMTQGAVRIEQLAERFDISLMTVHRDLDELQARGLLRKARGVATALSSTLVESSDVYRSHQQIEEKRAVATAARQVVEAGPSRFRDDSTTVLQMVKELPGKAPLTVITNVLTVLEELRGTRDVTLIGLGGTHYNWCNAFMGRMTIEAIRSLRADVFLMSAAAVTDDTCFFQSQETVDTKRAMFDSAHTRILLVDHTKFDKRALHAMASLSEYDAVVVDAATPRAQVDRLKKQGVQVVVTGKAGLGARRRRRQTNTG